MDIGRMWERLICHVAGHDWTSNAERGIMPTHSQLDEGIEGFWKYATMWCDRCGHVYEVPERYKNES